MSQDGDFKGSMCSTCTNRQLPRKLVDRAFRLREWRPRGPFRAFGMRVCGYPRPTSWARLCGGLIGGGRRDITSSLSELGSW